VAVYVGAVVGVSVGVFIAVPVARGVGVSVGAGLPVVVAIGVGVGCVLARLTTLAIWPLLIASPGWK